MNPKSKPKSTKVNHAPYNDHGERMILDGDNELADKITLLSSQMNAGEYQLLKLLAEFNRRKGWANRSRKREHAALWTSEVEGMDCPTGLTRRDAFNIVLISIPPEKKFESLNV